MANYEARPPGLTIRMAPIPSENGVEGDDEREEEEEEDEEEEEEVEEEEEEEEEEEPRLKYQRMGGSIPSLLASDGASCVAVAERMIALGTHDGTVHILDFLGNQVSQFLVHSICDLWWILFFLINFNWLKLNLIRNSAFLCQ